jgi:hypothetical protein
MSPSQISTSPPRALSASRLWAPLAALYGWLLAVIALCAANITVAGGGYQDVLRIALVAALLAAGLFVFGFYRGGVLVRVLSAVGALPVVFVVLEFFRRYQF